jgi:hypothetical protein
MAFMVPAMERFSGSAGASFLSPGLRFEMDMSRLLSFPPPVIPAKAGIHKHGPLSSLAASAFMDSGLRCAAPE